MGHGDLNAMKFLYIPSDSHGLTIPLTNMLQYIICGYGGIPVVSPPRVVTGGGATEFTTCRRN